MRSPRLPSSAAARARWAIGAVAVVVLLIVGGPWLYINVIKGDEPEKFTLGAQPSATTSAATSATDTPATASGTATSEPVATSGAQTTTLEGDWTIGEGSLAGYRVNEVLFGQSAEAVGRTEDIEGALTVTGNEVPSAEFTVDMTTVSSDKSKRDGQFHGRIMDTATHPTATFKLTKAIALPAEVGAGKQFTASATGDLTLKGTTKSVTFDVQGQRSGAGFDLVAQIPIVFADYDIPNPSIAAIKTEDHGVLEVLLKLVPKA